MSRSGASGLLVAVALILGLASPLDRVLAAIGMLGGLLVWAFDTARAADDADPLRWVARARLASVCAAGAALLPPLPGAEERLALLALLSLACGGMAGRAGSILCAGALAWRLTILHVPWIWRVEVEFSRLLSHAAGRLTGQSIDFGPSASGLDLFMLYLFMLLALRAVRGAGETRLVRRAVAGLALLGPFAALLPLLGQTRLDLPPAPQSAARVMFGWSAALMAALCLLLPGRPRQSRSARPALSPFAAVTSIALALAVAGGLAAWRSTGAQRRPGDVVLISGGAFDMEVPVAGRYGARQAGMFGMLPRYLALDGHRLRLHEGAIDAGALADASVVIVALPRRRFEPDERQALESFARAGGSLLVLADHTDLLGTMDPIDDLTGRWGIHPRFDSAFAAVREWSGCLDAARPDFRSGTGIGTGASLRLEGAARPLIVGRHGLADGGDRGNGGAGAFLGNYTYDPGEQLGDVVLAAETRLSRGRLVVFGDTSSFQNLMLPSSYPFVAALLDDLSRDTPSWTGAASVAAGVAAMVLGFVALCGSPVAAAGLAAAQLVSAIGIAAAAPAPPLSRLAAGAPVALVDAAHLNRYAREMWHEESIGGLIVNLQRDGYLPLLWPEGFERKLPGRAALPVLIAPSTRVSATEAATLAGHLAEGGSLLLAAGGDESAAVAPLLSPLGLSIGSLPLGPVPILPDMDRAAFEAQRRQPQFRRAYPVASTGVAPVRSLYRAFEHDVVVEARPGGGSGRLLVIGDPDFLTDRVLEDENGAWEGNVSFLRRLLEGERG